MMKLYRSKHGTFEFSNKAAVLFYESGVRNAAKVQSYIALSFIR